ncbi:upstream activation factor subunit UAF30 [Mytilus galloprovincialis]|uniref:Upstream activation factor subunit UAF30 n=1 Tax=Mytilus galloprovincialis TaxID=29158 RepID=A0A8B6DH22_MYTGA|nr:upstream activation factor subunit UAF30 [Mytilus galloprovincialis]
MALTQDQLRKAIKDILKDADLDSLSAKKVRLQLQEQYDTDLSDKRKVIDQLVMELIEESQDSQENEDDPSSEEEELEDEPPKKKPKPTKKATITKPKPPPKKTPEKVVTTNMSDSSDGGEDDEAMAQKLQEELNSGGRRTRSRNTKKKERKTPVKREKKGTSAYSRPCLLSQELADVMGADKLARNEVVKKMWQIIKERNLQWDEQLLPIFGKKKVKTFGMMKYLKNHIKDAKDVTS